jgi:hypothetical protein
MFEKLKVRYRLLTTSSTPQVPWPEHAFGHAALARLIAAKSKDSTLNKAIESQNVEVFLFKNLLISIFFDVFHGHKY